AVRTGGFFDVQDGAFEVRGGSPVPGVWTSEVIPIGGPVRVSVDVDDMDSNKERADFVRAYYILDGGVQVGFGAVADDLESAVELSSPLITGSTVQIVLEGQVSGNNEIYRVDNVRVLGDAGTAQEFSLTINDGTGDGSFLAGTEVTVTADAAPSGQEFDIWTGDVSGLADTGLATTTLTMPSSNVTLTATYRDISTGDTDVVWWEDFGDLADGTTVD
ncbi:InlB B-repeat-containing protein, partial [Croceitalea sp. MTPC5]|uniref:InlB B-repeat-containing protein n=1 Tax=Croceitalea sp. MTPC5 TaxID=3056565 RepID=UPI0030CBD7CA